MLTVSAGRTVVLGSEEERAAARAQLQASGYITLRGFLREPLLGRIVEVVERTAFYRRVHDGIGVELCAESGTASGALEFLMNDPELHRAIAGLAGCAPIRCFEGRIYRIVPATDHYDSWHSDVGQGRLLALSVNVGRDPFEGGALQLRRAASDTILAEVHNPTVGDAVLFRIDPSLRHRVQGIVGRVPRTAYAGWFRSEPDFRQLLAARLTSAALRASIEAASSPPFSQS
jgi:hypothetical protein